MSRVLSGPTGPAGCIWSGQGGRYNSQMPSAPIASPEPAILRRVVLDNGVTVYVQPMRTAPLASVWCWYKVG